MSKILIETIDGEKRNTVTVSDLCKLEIIVDKKKNLLAMILNADCSQIYTTYYTPLFFISFTDEPNITNAMQKISLGFIHWRFGIANAKIIQTNPLILGNDNATTTDIFMEVTLPTHIPDADFVSDNTKINLTNEEFFKILKGKESYIMTFDFKQELDKPLTIYMSYLEDNKVTSVKGLLQPSTNLLKAIILKENSAINADLLLSHKLFMSM